MKPWPTKQTYLCKLSSFSAGDFINHTMPDTPSTFWSFVLFFLSRSLFLTLLYLKRIKKNIVAWFQPNTSMCFIYFLNFEYYFLATLDVSNGWLMGNQRAIINSAEHVKCNARFHPNASALKPQYFSAITDYCRTFNGERESNSSLSALWDRT